MVLDLELCAELNNHSVYEVGTIVRDNYIGDSIPIDKIMFYELLHTSNHAFLKICEFVLFLPPMPYSYSHLRIENIKTD